MRNCLSCIFILFSILSYGQGRIEGKVKESGTDRLIPQLKVKLVAPTFERFVSTNSNGEFQFDNLNTGIYTIVISEAGFFESSVDVDYIGGETKVLEDIVVERQQQAIDITNEIPVMDQSEDDAGNAVASLLNSSRDVFVSNALFGLGQGNFNLRGMRFQDETIFINGIPIENIIDGNNITFSDFTGLNDVLRSRNNYYGIKAIPFTFGEQTTNVDIDAEAINQRKGLRVGQSFSNRNFFSRTTATYSTGLLKNNFAFSGSFSFRGAKEGYIPGTATNVISGYLSVSKVWSSKLNTTLSALYTDNKRAVSRPVIKEFYDLAGTNYYNPNWGYQDGEKRSGSIRRDNVPIFILSNEFKPSSSTHIYGSLAYQFGKRYREGIDWYNSYNPLPTYYRNVPSYYEDDPTLYQAMYNNLINNPDELQIQWDRFYESNRSNRETVPTQNTTGNWARYLMNREVSQISNIMANLNVRHQLNNRVDLSGGAMFQMNNTTQYREIADLLGADFFVNINQFAQRANPDNPDAIHNDLNNPYGIVKVGDKYGYYYTAKAMNATIWGQSVFTFNKIDAFVGVRAEYIAYGRNGKFKNGAYANNSYGDAPSASFVNIDAKGGLTYKIDGKNYVAVSGARWSYAPTFEQTYVLPRTTNILDKTAVTSNLMSGELSYYHRGARVKANLTGFYTQSSNESEVRRFFTELTNSFGSLVMRGVGKRYMGIEAAVEAKIATTGFTATALANVGDYTYTTRPTATFYYDNSDQASNPDIIYFQGIHLAAGPQIAGLLKLNYNSKQFWSASLTANYFDKIYAEASPQRRTTDAVLNIPVGSDLYNRILTQERMPSAITLDAYFRKSFMLNKFIKSLKNRMYFDVNISVNNILDKKDYATIVREQLRFDFRDRDPDKFPNTYSYMMGRNYYINFVFRM